MRYPLILISVLSLAACQNSTVDQLMIENNNLQNQLSECQKQTAIETARADVAEKVTIQAQAEAQRAKQRASEAAVMALEIAHRMKKKK